MINLEPNIMLELNRVSDYKAYGYDEKMDIWSLGAICYELLVGKDIYDSNTMKEILAKINLGNYYLPITLSKEAISFLNCMLQFDPKKRLSARKLCHHKFLKNDIKTFTKVDLKEVKGLVEGEKLRLNYKDNQIISDIFGDGIIEPDDEDEDDIDFKEKKPVADHGTKLNSSYKPPLIGLKNLGDICYMNASIQCLSQIFPLVNYFKNSPKVKETIIKYQNKCLTESFKLLIDNLWPESYNNDNLFKNSNNNYYFYPYEFKEKISKMNSLFEGFQVNDPKNLINFIIMTLHEELNKGQNNTNDYSYTENINQENKELVLVDFMNYFNKENKSIISDIFYGIHHTTTLCKQCNILKHNFEVYFFLTFPLEGVRKYKLQLVTDKNNYIMNQMNINNNIIQKQEYNNNLMKINLLNLNIVDIYDCFEYNQKIEEFTGDNSLYCDTCKNQLPATTRTKLYNVPEVLIIILNRGYHNQLKAKLKFDFQLNLMNYLENPNSGYLYELIGLITHLGKSELDHHFIATCKSPVDNIWYQYNDDLVSPVTDTNEQIFDFGTPYILFFKKIK